MLFWDTAKVSKKFPELLRTYSGEEPGAHYPAFLERSWEATSKKSYVEDKKKIIYSLVFSSFFLPSQILNIKFDWFITYYLLHNERKGQYVASYVRWW
jgi:hypothetical protein